MATVSDLAQAIAQFEGFNSPGSIAARNNNPGNLRSWGSNPVVGGFASFPTPEAGWAALESQVQTNINRGLTLNEFFGGKPGVYGGYAPAADSNQPATYASTVASWLGIPADATLADVIGGGGSGSGSSDTGESGGVSTGTVVQAAAVVGALALGWMLLRG
jgi:hypothetical protein